MSGDRTTPRFDVVATTRRNWSTQQKRSIVAEVDVGGATLSEVARRHGVLSSQLFRWRRAFRSQLAAPPIACAAAPASPPSFVPLLLTAPPPTPTPELSAATQPGAIEIVLAGGRIVRVSADVDPAGLVRIIAALEGHAEGVREKSR